MKLKNIALLSACLTGSIYLQAQSNFHKATLHSIREGDRQGWIDYREWDQNPESFRFKTAPGSPVVRYTRSELNKVIITGLATYERAFVSISTDKRGAIERLSVGADKRSRTDTVFLKLVTTGPSFNLYSYTDDIKIRYYVRDNSAQTYTELTYQQYSDGGEPPRIVTSNVFRNQLQGIALRTPHGQNKKLIGKLASVRYEAGSLGDIINILNGKQASRKEGAIGVFAGISLYSSSARYQGGFGMTEGASTSTSYLPKVTAGFDLFSNKDIRRIIYRLELGLGGANLGLNKPESNGRTSSHEFKQFTFSLCPQILYNIYNKEKLQFNIGAGFGANFSYYENSPAMVNVSNYPREEQVNFRNPWFHIPLRAGVIIRRKWDAYFQYHIGGNLTGGNTYLRIHTNAWQAGINFMFD